MSSGLLLDIRRSSTGCPTETWWKALSFPLRIQLLLKDILARMVKPVVDNQGIPIFVHKSSLDQRCNKKGGIARPQSSICYFSRSKSGEDPILSEVKSPPPQAMQVPDGLGFMDR